MAEATAVECRPGCGACCISPSISPAPSLPNGKPAGERCPHLDEHLACRLFGRPERPPVCVSLRPSREMCGTTPEAAMAVLISWERLTAPR
ncbi:MAG: YkgJ family cysteine cluster protein [Kofleriaceae bacterium]